MKLFQPAARPICPPGRDTSLTRGISIKLLICALASAVPTLYYSWTFKPWQGPASTNIITFSLDTISRLAWAAGVLTTTIFTDNSVLLHAGGFAAQLLFPAVMVAVCLMFGELFSSTYAFFLLGYSLTVFGYQIANAASLPPDRMLCGAQGTMYWREILNSAGVLKYAEPLGRLSYALGIWTIWLPLALGTWLLIPHTAKGTISRLDKEASAMLDKLRRYSK